MKTFEKSLLTGLILSILLALAGFFGKCQSINEKVLRLHIIANSNSTEDQDLKLIVRDKVLEYASEKFCNAKDKQAAQEITEQHLQDIRNIAQNEIHNQGQSYGVNTELANMYFSTRKYQELTLPAGNYDALKITIGKGMGRNWWCVMFPPMCLPAAEEKRAMKDVLAPREMDIVEGSEKFEVRFKLVEWFQSFKNLFNSSKKSNRDRTTR